MHACMYVCTQPCSKRRAGSRDFWRISSAETAAMFSLYTFVYVCIYIRLHKYGPTYTYIITQQCSERRAGAYTHAYIHTHMYIQQCSERRAGAYTHTYIHTYIHTCTYNSALKEGRVHTHMHTYIHPHMYIQQCSERRAGARDFWRGNCRCGGASEWNRLQCKNRIFLCMCVCMCVCIYIYIYIDVVVAPINGMGYNVGNLCVCIYTYIYACHPHKN
jgi:hypothetical protein